MAWRGPWGLARAWREWKAAALSPVKHPRLSCRLPLTAVDGAPERPGRGEPAAAGRGAGSEPGEPGAPGAQPGEPGPPAPRAARVPVRGRGGRRGCPLGCLWGDALGGPGKRGRLTPRGSGQRGCISPSWGMSGCVNGQGCTRVYPVFLPRPQAHILPPHPPRDQLNALRREKQKLVEKIMDQYRVLEPGPLPRTK